MTTEPHTISSSSLPRVTTSNILDLHTHMLSTLPQTTSSAKSSSVSSSSVGTSKNPDQLSPKQNTTEYVRFNSSLSELNELQASTPLFSLSTQSREEKTSFDASSKPNLYDRQSRQLSTSPPASGRQPARSTSMYSSTVAPSTLLPSVSIGTQSIFNEQTINTIDELATTTIVERTSITTEPHTISPTFTPSDTTPSMQDMHTRRLSTPTQATSAVGPATVSAPIVGTSNNPDKRSPISNTTESVSLRLNSSSYKLNEFQTSTPFSSFSTTIKEETTLTGSFDASSKPNLYDLQSGQSTTSQHTSDIQPNRPKATFSTPVILSTLFPTVSPRTQSKFSEQTTNVKDELSTDDVVEKMHNMPTSSSDSNIIFQPNSTPYDISTILPTSSFIAKSTTLFGDSFENAGGKITKTQTTRSAVNFDMQRTSSNYYNTISIKPTDKVGTPFTNTHIPITNNHSGALNHTRMANNVTNMVTHSTPSLYPQMQDRIPEGICTTQTSWNIIFSTHFL